MQIHEALASIRNECGHQIIKLDTVYNTTNNHYIIDLLIYNSDEKVSKMLDENLMSCQENMLFMLHMRI